MLMGVKGIILWVVFISVCAAIIIKSRSVKKEIEQSGIETTGVISRIVGSGDPESVDFDYYVRYCTEEGKEEEAVLSNPTTDLTEGQQVRIKYHQKYTQNARLI